MVAGCAPLFARTMYLKLKIKWLLSFIRIYAWNAAPVKIIVLNKPSVSDRVSDVLPGLSTDSYGGLSRHAIVVQMEHAADVGFENYYHENTT
jgi:hypothetical protein